MQIGAMLREHKLSDRYGHISHKAFLKSSCKTQFPYAFVNSSFFIADVKKKLTSLCGNWLLPNDVVNTGCVNPDAG